MKERAAVVGAGSWGTTLANLLAKKGHPVRIWSFESDVADSINTERENRKYLPGIQLAEGLEATTSVIDAVADAATVVSVSPSQHVRRVMGEAAPALRRDTLVVSASKGIETSTLRTMAQVFEDVLPRQAAVQACFLSGPSFAREVARELPAAVAVASRVDGAARRAQQIFQTDYFRVYTNPDVHGVELGGALKNVIALAAGMSTGLELGHNALAALITRGAAEMTRLGVALGASAETFAGLAGVGDLILTCTGALSRNRRVGEELGRGRRLEEILAEMHMVAEGVETARAALALAENAGVEMPIVAEVHAVLFDGRPARRAVENLMTRDPKPEAWR